MKYEYYPVEEYKNPFDRATYYVEFSGYSEHPEEWRLFKRCYLRNREEYESLCKENNLDINDPYAALKFGSIEGHPYQLANGIVLSETLVSMHTKSFLKFLVDSLNRNTYIEENKEKIIDLLRTI